MAQLQKKEPLEYITQENSSSTAVSVIYKSDSIFEDVITRKTVILQDFLKDYMPRENADLIKCDILLSDSEFTVDSNGNYCEYQHVDSDTNCCIIDNVVNTTNLSHSCLSTSNFTDTEQNRIYLEEQK